MQSPQEPYPLARKLYPMLRQSVLQSFDQCALLSRFEREYRGGWSYSWQARGDLFHRFAARAMAEMYRQGENTIEVDVALAILHETLRQQDVDRVCPNCEGTRIRKGVTKMGFRLCLDCKHRFETEIIVVPMAEVQELYWVVKKWAHDNAWSIQNLVDVEHRLKANVEYPNPYGGYVERTLTGQIDALEIEGEHAEHAIILDWKDMWGLPAPTDVSFEGYFQQRFYGWLVMRNYRSVESVTTREFYVRFSQPREATVYRYQLDDLEAEIAALVERFDRTVQERVYVPSPGKHCSFCPTPQKCPIPADARGDGAITSREQAELAAATVVVAEMTLEKRRRALKAWCGQHGPVEVKNAKGRTVMGFRPHPRTLRPDPEEIEQAERYKGAPLTAHEIRGLYRTVEATRFESYTPDPRLESEEDERLLASLAESLAQATAA